MTHNFASIPMQTIGPLRLIGDVEDEVMVPLATYETPCGLQSIAAHESVQQRVAFE